MVGLLAASASPTAATAAPPSRAIFIPGAAVTLAPTITPLRTSRPPAPCGAALLAGRPRCWPRFARLALGSPAAPASAPATDAALPA